MPTNGIRLRNHPPTDVQKTIRLLPELLDAHYGLIQSISWYQPRREEPDFLHCHAVLSDVSVFTGQRSSRGTGGTAIEKDIALAKAIGESVERYCGDICNPKDFAFASYRRVSSRATDPRRFVLFDARQYEVPDFPFQRITNDDEIHWVEGFSLTRNRSTLVPASQVHLSCPPLGAADQFELGPVSGYACGATLEEALLSGLLEVIERDAFMIFWYNQLPVPGLDLRAGPPAVRARLDRYHCCPGRILCINITSDTGVPTALSIWVSPRPDRPAAVVATAADVDPARAVCKSLEELAANHIYVSSLLEDHPRMPLKPADVVDSEDHGLFYCSPRWLPRLNRILRPAWKMGVEQLPSLASGDVKTDLETCVRRLEELNVEVIAVDLTTPEIEELGLKVVKVLAPGMQPLDFGWEWNHWGGRRILEAPVRMGFREKEPRLEELCHFPHPFP